MHDLTDRYIQRETACLIGLATRLCVVHLRHGCSPTLQPPTPQERPKPIAPTLPFPSLSTDRAKLLRWATHDLLRTNHPAWCPAWRSGSDGLNLRRRLRLLSTTVSLHLLVLASVQAKPPDLCPTLVHHRRLILAGKLPTGFNSWMTWHRDLPTEHVQTSPDSHADTIVRSSAKPLKR